MNEGRLNTEPIGNFYPGQGQNEYYNIDLNTIAMDERTPEEGLPQLEPGQYQVRNVLIRPLHHGYVVKLDCHEFAFETSETALKYIDEYLKDPSGTEEKWWKKELFK